MFDANSAKFSNVEIPAGMEIYNHSSIVYLSATEVFVTGGVDTNFSSISNSVKFN